MGFKGERGFQGAPGRDGLDGYPGLRGEIGDPAPPPPPPKSRGYIFTKHSQTVHIPDCPLNTIKLWDGYSLVSVIGSSRSVGQDLGSAGSCMRKFSTMPYLFCDINNVCNYATNNDDSIWLASPEPMPMSMAPMKSREVAQYISRCSVCETTTRVIAIHSQTMAIPDCPGGWEELWIGYSYVMHTTDNSGGFGMDLTSPGSCLEEFRAQPVIECHGHGTCNFYDGITSFWLTIIEDGEEFNQPKQQTLKADQTSKISRCIVCRRKAGFLRVLSDGGISASALRRPDIATVQKPYYPPPPPAQPPRRRIRPGNGRQRNRHSG